MNIRPVQQQGNDADWGLFTIAFAVTLAFGDKPKMISYDESNLWRRPVEYLKLDKFSPFPEYKNNKRVKRARAVTINWDFYCICPGSYFKEDIEDRTDNFMAPCCVCYEWYHKKFMKIPMNVFRSDSIGCGDVNLSNRFESLTTHM